jgi:hypothetical protein
MVDINNNTGRHYDVVIYDDVVIEDKGPLANALRQHLKEYYKDIGTYNNDQSKSTT